MNRRSLLSLIPGLSLLAAIPVTFGKLKRPCLPNPKDFDPAKVVIGGVYTYIGESDWYGSAFKHGKLYYLAGRSGTLAAAGAGVTAFWAICDCQNYEHVSFIQEKDIAADFQFIHKEF
jgi:hypothetical protein